MEYYTAGIAFSRLRTHCALILKRRPDWQDGWYNAIGGKVEQDERPIDTMYREFQEEAGLEIPREQWEFVLNLHYKDEATVSFYKTFPNYPEFDRIRTMTDERVEIVPVAHLPISLMPNLRWIIPLMLAKGVQPFSVRETSRGGL